jgi:MFS transporter, SP family, major inositol transporter
MRGLGMGVSVLFLWIANAIISFSFPVLIDAFNIQGTFLVFFGLGLIAIIFLKKMLPETGNRSLEELEEAFSAGNIR